MKKREKEDEREREKRSTVVQDRPGRKREERRQKYITGKEKEHKG